MRGAHLQSRFEPDDGRTAFTAACDARLTPHHTQNLNTPRLVADDTQKTVWKWEQQEPFGAGACNPDSDGDNVQFEFNLRFPGQYFDRETNLHYNNLRDYGSEIGRYMQSDPIGLNGGENAFSYANSSPLRFVDPTGEAGLLGALIGAGIEIGIQAIGNIIRDCDVFDDQNYDWTDVAISSGVGLVAPGFFTVGKTIVRSGGAIRTLSSQLARSTTPARAAKIEGRIQRHTGEIADAVTVQGAFQAGKAIGKAVNGDSCKCRK